MNKGIILVNSKQGIKDLFVVGVRTECTYLEQFNEFAKKMVENKYDFDCKISNEDENVYLCSGAKEVKPRDLASELIKLEQLEFEFA